MVSPSCRPYLMEIGKRIDSFTSTLITMSNTREKHQEEFFHSTAAIVQETFPLLSPMNIRLMVAQHPELVSY